MFRHRSFWIILVITAIVWLGVTMSEHNDYPLEVKVEWVGYDSARYVVTHADTLLPLTIRSNCFLAIGRYQTVKHQRYQISVTSDTVIKVGEALFEDLLNQFAFHGTHGVKSSTEKLSLSLVEQGSKGFVPQLRNVDFDFAEQCGLSGNPTIEPDTVWLYGNPSNYHPCARPRMAEPWWVAYLNRQHQTISTHRPLCRKEFYRPCAV